MSYYAFFSIYEIPYNTILFNSNFDRKMDLLIMIFIN